MRGLVAPLVDDVAMLRWPQDGVARDSLAREGRARLLLVDADSDPPKLRDALEDWVRVPSDPIELYARRRALGRRQAGRAPAVLDDDGLLRRGAAWIALSQQETVLVRRLLEERGRLVRRHALLAVLGAPPGAERTRLLDRCAHRLRPRLAALGLTLHTVRGSGFVLESDEVG